MLAEQTYGLCGLDLAVFTVFFDFAPLLAVIQDLTGICRLK